MHGLSELRVITNEHDHTCKSCGALHPFITVHRNGRCDDPAVFTAEQAAELGAFGTALQLPLPTP